MTFLDLARKRCSVRGYTDEPVAPGDLDAILEAGRIAPSAANRQPWHFMVVTDAENKKKLARTYGRDWFWKAPVILIVCVEPSKAWVRSDGMNYAYVDGALAMDHMTLCAADLGLGTCWVGAFDAAELKRAMNLPDGIEVVGMTPLGHPVKKDAVKSRKAIGELLHRETW